ncbi:MAG: hypothetical protein ABGY24_15475 [bacterium]
MQPWWATLATGGAAVRLGLYPLTRRAQEATAVVVSAFREAQERVSGSANGSGGVYGGSARLETVWRARDMIRAHPQRTSPLWMVAAPVAQVSVLVYGLYSVRYMAKEGWRGLDVGGPFWAVDLTLPAVDVATMSAPLGMQGIVMPAALLGGFMVSIQKLRSGRKKVADGGEGTGTGERGEQRGERGGERGGERERRGERGGGATSAHEGLTGREREEVQRWAMGNLATALEVMTIPLMFGVLTSPQAPLYYWTASVITSLGMGAEMDRRRRAKADAAQGGVLSKEAVALLQQAASRVSKGDYGEALGYLKQARVLAPRNASVHMALGDVLSSLSGREGAAAMHYRQVVDMYKGSDGDRVADAGSDVLLQRAQFALGMLLSRDDGTKPEGLQLLEQAASKVARGAPFKTVAVRSLLAIAALSENAGRRREALALATSADAEVAGRLKKKKSARRPKTKSAQGTN